ncbi:MAG: DUF1549 domain-containing protein [Planctomycetaceae bacterium]|nr:DUF1549 domain-containing protein [Planctomycetaceae bacterium]
MTRFVPSARTGGLVAWAALAVVLASLRPVTAAETSEKPKADAGRLADDAQLQPIITSVDKRFAAGEADAPDFGRHVVPLMGRLGCNGRSCHGSFQGQGGFRLSLFGYDAKADHEALLKGDEPRVNVKEAAKSLFLAKPTQAVPHEGGQRMKDGSWEHRLLLKWIESGAAPMSADTPSFVRLDVTPTEIHFAKAGDVVRLQAIAVWSDGRREDVTPLCRFQTNDETIATIDINGVVTGGEAGDSNVIAFYDKAVVPVPVMRAVSDKIGPKYPKTPTPTEIDRLVVAKLQKLGVVQSDLCTDAEFLRRVSLDLTGTLPTAGEVEAFLADSTNDKRDRKIDELLERPAYAAWWATRFCDWTGNNPAQLNNVSPVQNAPAREWYDWMYKRVEANTPYDQLVAGVVLATGQKPGQSYTEYCKEMSDLHRPAGKGETPTAGMADRDSMPYFWARRNLRQPEEKALAFAYSFMGLRIQCAQCHKHPFDVWTQDDYKQFQNFFTRIGYGLPPDSKKEQKEIIDALGIDGKKGGNDARRLYQQALKDGKTIPFEAPYVAKAQKNNRPQKQADKNRKNPRPTFANSARVLGGEIIELADVDDPREPLMAWLRDPENPYFAKAIVNRVWSNYFSVGIVEPADDLSLANPPSNRALLDHLAKEFVAHGFDMKWLHKEIVKSRTYQLSWVPNETNKFDQRNFARSIPRRVAAEVAYDAVRQATASDAEVAAMQKDVFRRAIGGSSMPGRNGNGGGSEGYALTVFGRSTRDSNCDCDRSMEPSLLQTVFLRNDQSVLQMIEGSKGTWVSQVAGVSQQQAKADAAKKDAMKKPDAKDDAKKPEVAKDSRQISEIREEIARVEKRVAELKKDDKDGRAKKVAGRLEQLQKELKNAMARNTDGKDASDNKSKGRPADVIRKELAKAEADLEAAKKGENPKRIGRLTKQANQLRTELRETLAAANADRRKAEGKSAKGEPKKDDAKQVEQASATVAVPQLTPEQIVRTAYLRTLSRVPDAKETETSLAFLKESSSLADGVEGLLWALVNTKEFIVNH